MKAVKYGTTVLAGVILFLLTACNDYINEMIPTNDNFITGFKLDGQKGASKISGNTITIPWYEGIPSGPVSYQASVSPKASLLPVTEEYIQAAFFPGEDDNSLGEKVLEVIESIDAATDPELTPLIKGLIKQTPNFSIPPPQPVNFSGPVTFLVISGRDGKIRRYTTSITVTVMFESNEGRRVPAQTVKQGGTATRPEDPTRTGYTFDNWYGDEGLTDVYDFGTPLLKNITLYAKWMIQYTVTFYANGGTGTAPAAQTVSGDTDITIPGRGGLARTGYTFGGWNTASDGNGDNYNEGDSFPVTGSIDLFAKWNPITYTVTYNPNGAAGDMDDTPFTYGVAQNLPSIGFTLPDNCTFAGWARTETGAVAFTDGQSVSNLTTTDGEIVTLFAIWTLNQYTVTFNTDGGSFVPSQTVPHGSPAGRPANPTRDGYSFDNWYRDSALTSVYNFSAPVDGNIILYAKWIANTYTVTYDKNATDAVGYMIPSVFTYGESQNLETNTYTRTGYTFSGWATASAGAVAFIDRQSVSNLTADNGGTVTLFAIWVSVSVPTYTVIYNANGGSGTMENSIFNIGQSQPLRENSFTRTGYTFSGWATTATGTVVYTNGQSVTDLAPAGGTVMLFAIWTLNQYTVTFNTNGGTPVPSQTVNHGDQADRPENPTRDGYTFEGWYGDSALTSVYNFSAPVTGNITLYAKWIGNTYTVTFNTNGGSFVPSQTVNPGGTATRPSNPTRTGYTFEGWYSDSALTSVYNFSTPVNSNITLYAKWVSGNHGVQDDQGPVKVGITVKSPDYPDGIVLPDDEKIIISRTGTGYPKTVTLTVDEDGYTFIEWQINSTNISGSEGSFTLNAANSYYNNLGEHFLTIYVVIDGKLYSRTITFIVVP